MGTTRDNGRRVHNRGQHEGRDKCENPVGYADGMTRFLYAQKIRIFDYPEFAMTLREQVCEAAALLAAEAGVVIEHVAKGHVRKEAIVAKFLEQRGDHPGLVHVISAMEACDALQGIARQADSQDISAPGQRQVPALLFLLYGRRTGPGPSAGSHLTGIPRAILLQRP